MRRPTPTSIPVLLQLMVSACGPSGPEVVTGFRGYPWGTHVSSIEEVAGTEPVAMKEGMVVHSAEVSLLGRQALAGFYFHPETGELLEGAYVFVLTVEDCESAFAEAAESVAQAFPLLEREQRVPHREGRDLDVYDNDCDYFVYNEHKEAWRADFTNPDGPGDHAGVWLSTEGRSPRMTIFYRSARAESWIRDWRKDHEGEEPPPGGLQTEPPPVPEPLAPRA